MTEQEFVDAFAPLVEEIAGSAVTAADLDTTFEDLNLDSLTLIELIGHVESEFGCVIGDTVLVALRTPRDLMEFLAKAKTAA